MYETHMYALEFSNIAADITQVSAPKINTACTTKQYNFDDTNLF